MSETERLMAALRAERDEDLKRAKTWFVQLAPERMAGIVEVMKGLCHHEDPRLADVGKLANMSFGRLLQWSQDVRDGRPAKE